MVDETRSHVFRRMKRMKMRSLKMFNKAFVLWCIPPSYLNVVSHNDGITKQKKKKKKKKRTRINV